MFITVSYKYVFMVFHLKQTIGQLCKVFELVVDRENCWGTFLGMTIFVESLSKNNQSIFTKKFNPTAICNP